MNPLQVLQEAFNFHQRGQLDQAEELYQRLVAHDSANQKALHFWGVLRNQRGDHARAIELIGQALEIAPGDFGAYSNHGLALAAAGRHPDAVTSFDRALAIKPDFYQAHYNRGISLASLERFAEAVASFDAALRLQPQSAAGHYNRGLSLASLGRLEDALAGFERALELDPKSAPAWDNRGNMLYALKRHDQALASHDKALSIEPGSYRIHYNRGTVLAAMDRHAEAVASHDAALEIDRRFFDAWVNRGNSLAALERFLDAVSSFDAALAIREKDVVALGGKAGALRQAGRITEALASCELALAKEPKSANILLTKALALHDAGLYLDSLADFDRVLAVEPDNAQAWNGRGAALHASGRDAEAVISFEKAIRFKPEFPDALNNHAHLLWTCKGDYAAAVADLERSVAIEPDQPFAAGDLLHLKMQGGDWSALDQARLALDAGIRAGKPLARPFVYQALSLSPADLQQCSRLFANHLFRHRAAPAFEVRRHRKIRLGYVSGEFKEQATAYLMAGLYERHNRDDFEVIAIDNTGPDTSPMRRRLEAAFDRMLDISRLDDDSASRLVRAEEIDILINLNGYFGAPRTGLFARRSAPIQVNYLGFPATLGATFMDYIIADRIVIPEEEKQFYDESVVWLPDCYQANDDKRRIAQSRPSRAGAGLPESAFVFCNFNQSYKLTPEIFASWMRILDKVPGSILWLLHTRGPFAENIRQAAGRYGVDNSRILFAPFVALEDHLARLACADLFLDTLPYNAHTTASDALWAGVPLLTCGGTSFPGRVAASMLGAVGLPELITGTMAQYESRAVELALDPAALTALRRKLEANRLTRPLFDTDLFRRHIEDAYAGMWARFVDGKPPGSFAVPSRLN
jgi:protein O-GlcNAc transferase